MSFKEKINTILTRMKGATKPEQRGMAFKGSIVCITSNKTLIHRNYFLRALCAYEQRGTSNIDYYKIMYLPNYAKTVAELLPSKWYKINPRMKLSNKYINRYYECLRTLSFIF